MRGHDLALPVIAPALRMQSCESDGGGVGGGVGSRVSERARTAHPQTRLPGNATVCVGGVRGKGDTRHGNLQGRTRVAFRI